MFGNRLGWGLSAVLTGLILLLVAYIAKVNSISGPSEGIISKTGMVALNLGSHPQILDPIELPYSPQAIMPAMTDPTDAAPVYRSAIEKYKADKYTYRDLFERGKPRTTSLKDLPALQLLIDARNCKTCNLFGANPHEVIGYERATSEPLDALTDLGMAAKQLSLYIYKDQPPEALQLAEAAFSLGHKMCEERLRWQEFAAGAQILRDGAFVIKSLDPARAQAANIEEPMRLLLKDRCIPLWTAIGSADSDVIARTTGDMFYIARNSKERMWRIEAILKLGRNKYYVGEFGKGPDQRGAINLLRRMSADPKLDPAVHAAAQAANDLTLEGYHLIGT